VVFVRGNSNATELWTMNADGSDQQQITNETLDVESPCWSPDGTKIVYSAEISSFDWDIKVVNADGSSPVTIVSGTQFDKDPDWSPDGTKITFLSSRAAGNGIYVANADGSGAGIMTATQRHRAVVVAGRSKIVFVSQRDGEANLRDERQRHRSPRLTDTTRSRTTPGSARRVEIVFSSRREDITQDIFVMNADGSGEVQITDVDANDLHPDW
jgi:Tol biopolymer transport system component